jgi:uncharacterized protein YciI
MAARYFALTYVVVDNFADKRMPVRELHLGHVRAAHARGELAMAGAIGEPIDGALLVFKAADASVVERFAREDPYVQRGLVTSWQVRPWHVVIGGDAAS